MRPALCTPLSVGPSKVVILEAGVKTSHVVTVIGLAATLHPSLHSTNLVLWDLELGAI